MGKPIAPVFDQDGFRGRDNVPDPSGVDAAFDAGDTAANTNFSYDADTILRMRLVVKQTEATAINHDALITEFIIQYDIDQAASWSDVGAVGGGTEGVDFIEATGFADGENTTLLLGGSGGVAGESRETNNPTDSVTFTTEALSECELEIAIVFNGGVLSDGAEIDLRVLYSDGDVSPPATAMGTTLLPRITVNVAAATATFHRNQNILQAVNRSNTY